MDANGITPGTAIGTAPDAGVVVKKGSTIALRIVRLAIPEMVHVIDNVTKTGLQLGDKSKIRSKTDISVEGSANDAKNTNLCGRSTSMADPTPETSINPQSISTTNNNQNFGKMVFD